MSGAQKFRIITRRATILRSAIPVNGNRFLDSNRDLAGGGGVRDNRAMVIGIPKEIKDQEYRGSLLPSAAYQLTCKAVADALGIEYFPFTA